MSTPSSPPSEIKVVSKLIEAWQNDLSYGPAKFLASELRDKLRAAKVATWTYEWRKLVEELDALFDNSLRSSDMILYHGCPKGDVQELLDQGQMTYPGYMPTSKKANVAGGFFDQIPKQNKPVFLKIHVPPGIPIIDVGNGLHADIHEDEVILPRDITLTTIYTYEKDESYVVEVEVSKFKSTL